MAGAHNTILRHSSSHGRDFNVFVSDVDLTVVSDPQRFEFLHTVILNLKRIFINLGEVEYCTSDEWNRIEELLRDPMDDMWNRLLLIRKLSWQTSSLSLDGQSEYQMAKVKRGIKLTQKKLDVNSDLVNFDRTFPEMFSSDSEDDSNERFSKFLERDIVFDNDPAARNFWSILPDSRNIPKSYKRKVMKLYVLEREHYLSLVSLRSDILTGKITHLEEKQRWIQDLQNRISALRNLLS